MDIELNEIVAALEGELVRVEDVGERRSPAGVESFLMKLYGQTWRTDAAWEGWQGTLGEMDTFFLVIVRTKRSGNTKMVVEMTRRSNLCTCNNQTRSDGGEGPPSKVSTQTTSTQTTSDHSSKDESSDNEELEEEEEEMILGILMGQEEMEEEEVSEEDLTEREISGQLAGEEAAEQGITFEQTGIVLGEDEKSYVFYVSFMEAWENAQGQGPAPPLSAEAIQGLERRLVQEGEEMDVCPICRDQYVSGDQVLLPGCNSSELHGAHAECMEEALNWKGVCPLCMQRL